MYLGVHPDCLGGGGGGTGGKASATRFAVVFSYFLARPKGEEKNKTKQNKTNQKKTRKSYEIITDELVN